MNKYKKILFALMIVSVVNIFFIKNVKASTDKVKFKIIDCSINEKSVDNGMSDCFGENETIYTTNKEDMDEFTENVQKHEYKTANKADMPLNVETAEKRYNTNYGYKDLAKRSNGKNRQKFYNEILKTLAVTVYNSTSTIKGETLNVDGEDKVYYSIGMESYAKYGLTQLEAIQTYYMFRNDTPYFYYMSCELLVTSNMICVLTDKDYIKYSQRKNYYTKIEDNIDSYDKLTKGYSTNYEKSVIVHDKMIMENDYSDVSNVSSHNIIGILAGKGITVCEGYAKVYQLLMNYLGINNVYVTGVAGITSLEGHAWNLVQMDNGMWYGVDVTWDDQPDEKGGMIYTFLHTNANYFKSTHTADESNRKDERFLYDIPEMANNELETYAYKESIAQKDKVEKNGIVYEINGVYAYVIGYNGTAKNVDIPKTVKNKVVRGIEEQAFTNKDKIEKITIADTVAYIDDATSKENGAFANCDNLKNVKMPNTLNYIGKYAFVGSNKITSMNVPKFLKNIKYNCLTEDTGIKKSFLNSVVNNISDINLIADEVYSSVPKSMKQKSTYQANKTNAKDYYTYNSSIAVIDNKGKITTKSAGNVIVVAKIDKDKYAVAILKVNKISISKVKISGVKNKIYKGSAIKQSIKVLYNNNKLKSGTDYKITYKNNNKIGSAKLVLTGLKNYTGTKSVTFKIKPSKVTNLKVASKGTNFIKLKWNKVKGVKNYAIERYDTNKKKYVIVKKVSTNTWKNTSLKKSKTYFYRVRAYKNNLYGAYSKKLKVRTRAKKTS